MAIHTNRRYCISTQESVDRLLPLQFSPKEKRNKASTCTQQSRYYIFTQESIMNSSTVFSQGKTKQVLALNRVDNYICFSWECMYGAITNLRAIKAPVLKDNPLKGTQWPYWVYFIQNMRWVLLPLRISFNLQCTMHNYQLNYLTYNVFCPHLRVL